MKEPRREQVLYAYFGLISSVLDTIEESLDRSIFETKEIRTSLLALRIGFKETESMKKKQFLLSQSEEQKSACY